MSLEDNNGTCDKQPRNGVDEADLGHAPFPAQEDASDHRRQHGANFAHGVGPTNPRGPDVKGIGKRGERHDPGIAAHDEYSCDNAYQSDNNKWATGGQAEKSYADESKHKREFQRAERTKPIHQTSDDNGGQSRSQVDASEGQTVLAHSGAALAQESRRPRKHNPQKIEAEEE